MEYEPRLDAGSNEKLNNLANQLERIMDAKARPGTKHIIMDKLIKRLRAGEAESAKIFLSNEFDKFMDFRDDALPLIVQELYEGTGSPWFSIERKLKQKSQDSE